MTAAPQTRFLRPTSERTFDVHDGDTVKGQVWRSGNDTDDSRRWRASAPNGAEWRPWRFFPTPQAAAVYVVSEYDRAAAAAAARAARRSAGRMTRYQNDWAA